MATQTKKVPVQDANKPVWSSRLKGVKASVFENKTKSDGRDIVFHKVALVRIYREGEEWKTTTSLSRDDLPVARLLLDRAWQFILEKEAGQKSGASEEEQT